MKPNAPIYKLLWISGIALAGVAAVAVFVSSAAAQSASASASTTVSLQGVTFPIAALGNCADQTACHAYCNDPAHMDACTTFAESHGLVSADQAQQAQQFASVLASGGGPGGCSSPDSCDAYCSSISHLDACISFAKAHNIGGDQIAQGEKIQSYLKSGGHMPGGCDSQNSCGTYCSDESHRQECMQFAESAGLPQGGPPGSNGAPSAEMEQKFNAILQSGNTPGGCTTLAACLIYCNDPSHGSACGVFGEAMGAGQGDMQVVQQGPGGCTSDATCKAYCADPSHAAECQQFESKSGNQGPQQAGPGGCTSDATCKTYCADPAHAAECSQFGHEAGNYVEGSSTGYGSPSGGCGENQYWNGSECMSSGAGGPGQAPPPCPPGQTCQTGYQPGNTVPPLPSSSTPWEAGSSSSMLAPLPGQADIISIFGTLLQNIWRFVAR